MYYKEDWDKAKERLLAFWKGEIIDRACVGILGPRKTSKIEKFPHLTNGPWLGGLEKFKDNDTESIKKWWVDPEENYKRAIYWMENTFFGGEAAPGTYVNWGASAGCAFWNCEPVFTKNSVWFEEAIKDWDEWKWEFNKETNVTRKQLFAITDYLAEKSDGRYFIGVPELGNGADNLSLMRGLANLAMDLVINPDQVKEAIEVMIDPWLEYHDEFQTRYSSLNQNGSVLAWLNLWAPGTHDQIANDFSYNISPDMFEEFFFIELRKMSSWLDYATFHLDGPNCIKNHLDRLLTLEDIDCIQFTPGVGSPPTTTPEYIPKFKQIQESGKKLYLLLDPHEIEPILDELQPEGLFINTYADSEEEAESIIKLVEKKSAKGNIF